MKKIKLKIRSGMAGYIIGSIAAALVFLAGCGEKEEVATPVIEQLDEEGNVIGSDVEDSDVAGSDAEDSNVAGSDAEDSNVAGNNAEENSESSKKNYLKYMTDDELKDLAEEALEGAGKKTDIIDGSIVTYGINYDLPEGFEPDQEKTDLYVTDRYPIDASSVRYIELDQDYTMQLMTEDIFKEFLEQAYLENYDETVSVDVTEFTETQISGVPAFRIKAEYDLEDIHLEHLIVMINGTKTYILDYTQTNEYDRMDLFEASAATISVKK